MMIIPPGYLFLLLFCFCLYGNNGRITSIYFLPIHFAVCTDLIIIGRRFFNLPFCKMSYYLWIWSLLYYIFHLYCCCGRSHNRLHLLPLTRSVLHSLHPTLLPLTSSLPEPPLQILHSKIHWSVLHSVS